LDTEKPKIHRIYIVESILGVFGINEGNEIVEKTLYPKDPKQIAAALSRQLNGELTREVSGTVENLTQRGFNRFIFSNGALAEAVKARWGVEVEVRSGTAASEHLRDTLEDLAHELMGKDASQMLSLSHDVSVLMARRAVGRALSERDATMSQTVHLLNDLDKTLNTLSGRLREWYGLHFPELSRLVEDHRTYAKIVRTLGDRGRFDPTHLTALGVSAAKAQKICKTAQGSMGAPLLHKDQPQIDQLAVHLLALYGYRRSLEEYISALAEEIAPNLSEIAGPIIAAKLMEKAGGLRKLAMKPSSTIQLLGAEKAMFRAMKSRSKPPKHGLIFQHPVVHSSPRRMRGRSARSLAAKLAIAARADAFSGRPIAAELKRELDLKLERAGDKNTSK